ncbi:hypothetical protein [Corynebacterium sp. HMSC076D02]|uniref:hypothetical protein n=1 Tax=Corynebacterium sp. HMSC076D02 TaxID=1739439 RepID=UPI0008BF75B9|nr:hypothetical protein [Corynebacterium sp. HMSC076D02]OFQ43846.1 hypothetical protein HMPREF2935_08310 [Corynebacterium sp. HMSC076D02]
MSSLANELSARRRRQKLGVALLVVGAVAVTALSMTRSISKYYGWININRAAQVCEATVQDLAARPETVNFPGAPDMVTDRILKDGIVHYAGTGSVTMEDAAGTRNVGFFSRSVDLRASTNFVDSSATLLGVEPAALAS